MRLAASRALATAATTARRSSDAAVAATAATRRWAATDADAATRPDPTRPATRHPPPATDRPDPPPASSSRLTRWVRSKLPTALGGDVKHEDLTLDEYAKTLARARRLGAATGFVGGTTAAADPGARGVLRHYEAIIAAIDNPAHRADPASMTAADRAAVAAAAGVGVAAVDDAVAKFQRVRALGRELARRKAAGEAVPTTIAELEAMVGGVGVGGAGGARVSAPRPAAGQAGVEAGATSPDGRACPFVGLAPARNAVCPSTKKKFKNCCGR